MKKLLSFAAAALLALPAAADNAKFETVAKALLSGIPKKCPLAASPYKPFPNKQGGIYVHVTDYNLVKKYKDESYYATMTFQPEQAKVSLAKVDADHDSFKLEGKSKYVYGGGFIPLPLQHTHEHWVLTGKIHRSSNKITELKVKGEGWKQTSLLELSFRWKPLVEFACAE